MINFTKGWPNMYAVDLAVPCTDTDILEGMGISLSSGKWIKGVPKGQVGYVTGPEQFPTALDVKRVQSTTFGNGDYGTASAGVGEMGRGEMGGIALSNPLEFQTDQYSALTGGEVVYVPNTGLFTQATDAANHQVAGQCRAVMSDLAAGNTGLANWQGGTTVAVILSLPSLLLP
jgi:phage tail protein X